VVFVGGCACVTHGRRHATLPSFCDGQRHNATGCPRICSPSPALHQGSPCSHQRRATKKDGAHHQREIGRQPVTVEGGRYCPRTFPPCRTTTVSFLSTKGVVEDSDHYTVAPVSPARCTGYPSRRRIASCPAVPIPRPASRRVVSGRPALPKFAPIHQTVTAPPTNHHPSIRPSRSRTPRHILSTASTCTACEKKRREPADDHDRRRPRRPLRSSFLAWSDRRGHRSVLPVH
jgi:hypothetical protein